MLWQLLTLLHWLTLVQITPCAPPPPDWWTHVPTWVHYLAEVKCHS